ncbi:SDR family oxidoreductase [Pseudopelagicola sp. nBUS_19]|uniref:SDR family oxidoreductase n=1 Tax=Pseudopelagicola sp. nBUS_19 TaxID=3395316 RepID=UPI003EBE9324
MRVLLIGESGGIGSALAVELRRRNAEVVGLSRRDGFDLTDPEAVEMQLASLSPTFDMIMLASGALTSTREKPEKSLRDVSAKELTGQFAVNAIGPALVLRHAPRLLPRKGRSIFAALSARVGSIGDNQAGGWYAYRASKSALNQIIRTSAIELSRSHRDSVCVALHPGTVRTNFTQNFPTHEKADADIAALRLLSVLDQLKSQDTGGFYDYSGTRVDW